MQMNNLINILIASRNEEDQKRLLAILSEPGFVIASIESDETGVIIRSERLKPEVLILDLQLSTTQLTDMARVIQRRSPSTAIVILAEKLENNLSNFLLKSGISGFLLKEEDIDRLAHIVKIIASGGCYISAAITAKIFNETIKKNQFPWQLVDQEYFVFSPMERNIITCLANGMSDAEIAKKLNYSTGSIRNLLTVIKRKTKFKNRIQIVVFALVSGQLRYEQLWIKNSEFIS